MCLYTYIRGANIYPYIHIRIHEIYNIYYKVYETVLFTTKGIRQQRTGILARWQTSEIGHMTGLSAMRVFPDGSRKERTVTFIHIPIYVYCTYMYMSICILHVYIYTHVYIIYI